MATAEPAKKIVPPRRAAFARRLRALRKEAGLTQTAIARTAGMDRSYYAEVETGQHSVSLDRIFSIADALSVDARALFTDEPAATSRAPRRA